MGAGNPLIKSFNPELYEAKTYYIDFLETTESTDEHEKYLEAKDHLDYFLCFEFLDIPFNFSDKTYEELSACYRGYANVLAEFENSILVSTSDSELFAYAIGIIPNFNYDDIQTEMEEKYSHREKWYYSRKMSFEHAIERYTTNAYKKRLKIFKKEAFQIMSLIHKYYGKQMRIRCGAWTNGSVSKINFKSL